MNRQTKRILAAVAVVVVGWVAQRAGIDVTAFTNSSPAASTSVASSASLPTSGASERIERAFARRESGFMITLDARVVKTLPDDNDGSRHQRFLIEIDSGRTILIAHNIDLAERIGLDRGDSVRVHGQYEWNEKGGVIHWTHHDPAGRHEGGFIEHAGRRFE